MSLWLALAMAGLFAIQAIGTTSQQIPPRPMPTCPPECPR